MISLKSNRKTHTQRLCGCHRVIEFRSWAINSRRIIWNVHYHFPCITSAYLSKIKNASKYRQRMICNCFIATEIYSCWKIIGALSDMKLSVYFGKIERIIKFVWNLAFIPQGLHTDWSILFSEYSSIIVNYQLACCIFQRMSERVGYLS